MRHKYRRLYLRYMDTAVVALLEAIDNINRVSGDYRQEATVILLANAWELLGKAVLLKRGESVFYIEDKDRSLSARDVVGKLNPDPVNEVQAQILQQIISLRDSALHGVMPVVPNEILFHLIFFSTKLFKDVVLAQFGSSYAVRLNRSFLSISFDSFVTYADKIKKLIAKTRKTGSEEQRLVWLLERGVRFQGGKYISQEAFNDEIKKVGRKGRIYNSLGLYKHVKNAEMVVVVPIQAPKGFTADISLRKGSTKTTSALPVMIKKTDVDVDYPHLTSELGLKLGKSTSFVAATIRKLGIMNNESYHQKVRSSKTGSVVHKYSDGALAFLAEHLKANPNYSPYR